MKNLKIGKKTIGIDKPTYFIADIAANHDGDLKRAKHLIYLAAEMGADAAKFQNFKANKIVSDVGFRKLGDQLSHQAKWKKSVFEVYKDASINPDWTSILKTTCDDAGIEYFTSPYDFDSVDTVDPYVNVHKIGSGDITWPEILTHIAKKGKPVILSTGASELYEIKRAMKTLEKETKKMVLLQCNTNYTGSLENFKYINLQVLDLYKKLFPGVILGLSDHTPGHATVLGSVAMGARVIEKHFTDDNDRVGPDHPFSMNPKTWKDMIDRTRELEAAMGDGLKKLEKNEKQSVTVQRRSLRATHDLEIGKKLVGKDLEALRPIPTGAIEPYERPRLMGKKLLLPLKFGEAITWKHVRTKKD
jgi:sialic acid synthase SpsE